MRAILYAIIAFLHDSRDRVQPPLVSVCLTHIFSAYMLKEKYQWLWCDTEQIIDPPRMRRRVMVVGSVCVCLCVCLSVKSHLTSGVSVRRENPVTYSVGNGGKKICGVFYETARLQRSSTPPLKAIRTVSHFPAESAHAYLTTRTQ